MSIHAMSWALALRVPNAGEKLTLIAICNYADERGTCYPGQERLSQETSQGVRTVQRHIKSLEKSGIIRREKRFLRNGDRTSDRFILNFDYSPPANLATGQKRHSPPANLAGEPSVNTPNGVLEPSGYHCFLQAEIDAAFDAYNDMVQRLPINANGKPPIPLCRKRTTTRRRSMKARLKDCGGLEGWGAALEKLASIPGLLGACGGEGHESWRADIDFLLSEQKFTRLMEGKYDNWGRGSPKNGDGPTMDDLRQAAAEADRREKETADYRFYANAGGSSL